MLLQYKTERLPLNFIMLGFTLIIVGVVTVFNGDYEGAAAFIFAIPLLFTHSGIMIDTNNRKIKNNFLFVTIQLNFLCVISLFIIVVSIIVFIFIDYIFLMIFFQNQTTKIIILIISNIPIGISLRGHPNKGIISISCNKSV